MGTNTARCHSSGTEPVLLMVLKRQASLVAMVESACAPVACGDVDCMSVRDAGRLGFKKEMGIPSTPGEVLLVFLIAAWISAAVGGFEVMSMGVWGAGGLCVVLALGAASAADGVAEAAVCSPVCSVGVVWPSHFAIAAVALASRGLVAAASPAPSLAAVAPAALMDIAATVTPSRVTRAAAAPLVWDVTALSGAVVLDLVATCTGATPALAPAPFTACDVAADTGCVVGNGRAESGAAAGIAAGGVGVVAAGVGAAGAVGVVSVVAATIGASGVTYLFSVWQKCFATAVGGCGQAVLCLRYASQNALRSMRHCRQVSLATASLCLRSRSLTRLRYSRLMCVSCASSAAVRCALALFSAFALALRALHSLSCHTLNLLGMGLISCCG